MRDSAPCHAPGQGDLVAAACGTALAAVCAVGLFQIERLLGGLWSLLAVLIAGGVCALLARAFGRMAEVVPSGAALLAYLSRGLGRRVGVVLATPYLLLTLFLVGAEATIVGALGQRLTPFPAPAVAGTFIVGTWLLCRAGVRVSFRAQALATWALVVGLSAVSLSALGQALAEGDLARRLLPPPPSPESFIAAVGQALFLFMGFEFVTAQVEVASPGAVRRALRTSVVGLTAVYGLVSLGFSCLDAEPRGDGAVFFIPQLALAEQAGGTPALGALALLSLLASFTSFNGALLALSRFAYALAGQGALPRAFLRVDARTLVPRAALLGLLSLSLAFTALVLFAGWLRPSILAGAVSAAVLYAASAWTREGAPYAEPGRSRLTRAGGRALALALAGLAVGVLADAGDARGQTLLLVICALGVSAGAAWRLGRRVAPQPPRRAAPVLAGEVLRAD